MCFRSGGAGGCGGVKTPPYGAIDTWAVMARLRAGHARPLRGWHKWVADERGKGGRQPSPFAVGGGCPGTGGDVRPVGTLQASLRGQLP